MRRYYKGTDIPFRLSIKDKGGVIIPLASFDSLEVIFRTSGEQYTKYYKGGGITENEDGTYRIYANENAFGLLPDGLLKYTVKYTINGNHDEIRECETDIIIKTPQKFQPKANVQDKSITVTENNSVSKVIPDGGYEGLGEVSVNVEIPFPLEIKEVSITENESTTTITTGDGYSGMSEVRINVDIPFKIDVAKEGLIFSECYFSKVPKWADFSNVENYDSMFDRSNLEVFSGVDTSKGINMHAMFNSCEKLSKIEDLDTSNATDLSYIFHNDNVTIPPLNTSKAINMSNMFAGFRGVIPDVLDTSNVEDMSYMFSNCYQMEKIPNISFEKVKNIESIFYYCRALKEIPSITSPQLTNARGFCYECNSLVSIGYMDVSNLYNSFDAYYTFNYSPLLENLGGFGGLKEEIVLSSCPNLTHDSLMNLINNAATVTSSTQMILGSTNLAKLTDREKAIATSKGWTLA